MDGLARNRTCYDKSPTDMLREEVAAIIPRSAQALGLLALIWIVFGALIPLRKGIEFYDPMILTAYASLGVIFAVPVVVRRLPEISLARVLARIAAAWIYGELMALGLLSLGIFLVYWTHRGGLYFPPAWGGVVEGAAFGAMVTLALAIAGSWLTLALTDSAAKFLLRIILLAALLAFVFQGRALPDVIWPAAGIALAIAVIFFALLRREIQRRTG